MKLILGSKNYSSWSLRPWLVLAHANIAFEEEVINLKQIDKRDKISKNSPSSKVPVLLHNGQVIWDSLAISEYIAELFPEKNLLPKDINIRAHLRSICAEMHSGFASMRSELPMDIIRSEQKILSADTKNDIARICDIWNDCLAKYHGPFLFGQEFTIADAFFAPVVTRFKSYHIKTDEICQNYMDKILSLPSMIKWYEDAKIEQKKVA